MAVVVLTVIARELDKAGDPVTHDNADVIKQLIASAFDKFDEA